MDDTRLDFKEAIVAQITDYLMIARLDETETVTGGGFYSVSDLLAFLNTITVEDILTSVNTTTALSANQGRALAERLTTIEDTFTMTDRTTGTVYKRVMYIDDGVVGFDLVEQV